MRWCSKYREDSACFGGAVNRQLANTHALVLKVYARCAGEAVIGGCARREADRYHCDRAAFLLGALLGRWASSPVIFCSLYPCRFMLLKGTCCCHRSFLLMLPGGAGLGFRMALHNTNAQEAWTATCVAAYSQPCWHDVHSLIARVCA